MILTAIEGNELIKKRLKESKPFAAGRSGSIEFNCISRYLNNLQWDPLLKSQMHINTGFFPVEDWALTKFCQLYLKHIQSLDLLASWLDELSIAAKNTTISQLRCLEPYYHKNPWTESLKDKKVLVIHPYQNSIISQYKNRSLLFENPDMLPQFSLDTIKAVQSIAGNKTQFETWFDAYDFMCNQISNKDFDIAIIGAGAYGLPLAGFVKDIGKKAVHIGGATQILFGIKGKRWDVHEEISALYNSHWIRPSVTETPQNHHLVEGGTYW